MYPDPYQETFETWNRIASLYEEKFMHLRIYDASYDYLCDHVFSEQAKILEIGCGPGNITNYLLKRCPDFKITGMDVAPNMIELAKKNNPRADFMQMDIRHLHELKNRYEAVVAGFCLPYLSDTDTRKLIADCSKILYPAGLLYLSFVEGRAEQSGYQIGSTGNRAYFYYHDLKTLNSQLQKNGFETLKVFHVNYSKTDGSSESHSIVIAKKVEG